MASPTQWNKSLSKLQEMVKDREPWRAAVRGLQKVRCNLATEQHHGAWSIQKCQQGMADTMTDPALTVAPATPVTTQTKISA